MTLKIFHREEFCEISSIQQKVLNSEFYLCPCSKPYLPNCLIDSQDFLTQTTQGSRHNKSKIKSYMDVTFLTMAVDSPVPVLSGTHSMCLNMMAL